MEKSNWRIYHRCNQSLLDHLCQIRGISIAEISPNFEQHLHDPNLLPDIDSAKKIITTAKQKNWVVAIFGDYDADGTPAVALLSDTFKRLGIEHQTFLPTRTTGYGLSQNFIEEIAGHFQLLITVDTGINSVAEIDLAKVKGIQVIVIDHHLPGSVLPPADAVIDPFVVGSKYPFPYLCGCALAYKVVCSLQEIFPQQITEGYLKWLLDLVAISTVADMMPLVGENRALVHYGLKVLSKTRRVGLLELMDQAQLSGGKLSSYSLGFIIGPRLNASGRIEDNRPALDLLLATDRLEAKKLAQEIERANCQRQQMVREVAQEAEKLIWQQNSPDDKFIIISSQNWPTGVLGLVAGRLTSQFSRPVAVLNFNHEGYSGSARSTESYPLVDGLTATKKYLKRFGGHKQAAGLATTGENFPKFVKAIKADAAKKLTDQDIRPTIVIDAELDPAETTLEMAEKITELAPFGFGNPQPLFLFNSLIVTGAKRIGQAGDHLKFTTLINDSPLEVVAFGKAQQYWENPETTIDVVGSLEINNWQNRRTLQINLKDYRVGGRGIDEKIAIPTH